MKGKRRGRETGRSAHGYINHLHGNLTTLHLIHG